MTRNTALATRANSVHAISYKAALQPDTPPNKEVESAMEKIRRKKSLRDGCRPRTNFADYGINSFPGVAVIDKAGRLRYAGSPNGYDSGQQLDRLVRQLLDEQVQS